MRFSNLSSFARQNLLLEFASLKHACPEGVYVALSPGDVSLWSGVMFVRKGPYAPALLRFQISFPVDFPRSAPLLTFSTDLFHPLLTPLTTYSSRGTDASASGSGEAERLPPGGFSLRHRFPQWYDRADSVTAEPVTVYNLLEYARNAFTDESVLDSLPLDAVANTSAYHAWRSHQAQRRKDQKAGQKDKDDQDEGGDPEAKDVGSPERARARRPGEWNWEGVWEERVRKGIQNSMSDVALFGGSLNQDEIIRFSEVDEETALKLSEDVKLLLGSTNPEFAIHVE